MSITPGCCFVMFSCVENNRLLILPLFVLQVYQRSQRNKSNIHKVILESARTLDLYLENPRMVPKNISPVCQKMFITVAAKSPKNTRYPVEYLRFSLASSEAHFSL